jgi:hypothetical protein
MSGTEFVTPDDGGGNCRYCGGPIIRRGRDLLTFADGSEAHVGCCLRATRKPGTRGLFGWCPVQWLDNRFGRLVVVAPAPDRDGRRYLRCRCDCGGETECRADHLAGRRNLSCGCWHRERPRGRHGGWRTPEYSVWQAIKARCRNPENLHFKNYGGRGIDVCAAWHDDFAAFIADVGPRPSPLHTIERVDNSRGYEPGNVVWATRKQQQRNLRTNRLLTCRGRTQCLAAWVEEVGLKYATVVKRLRSGWSVEDALYRPVDEHFGPRRRSA